MNDYDVALKDSPVLEITENQGLQVEKEAKLSSRHLLELRRMKRAEIELILDTAETFKEVLERPIRTVPALRGVTVANLFYEASTRTRVSFELAEKRLSAEPVSFAAVTSSTKKGETLSDTAKNIEAMKVDIVVIRHPSSGAPHFLSRILDSVVINAGDGSHEHPTQGLLDILTIRERLGTLAGIRVVIVGDILHSRVARSNIWGLREMGASVGICGPPTLMPPDMSAFDADVYYNLDEAISDADVIMALRIQLERQVKGLFPSVREYHKLFGITKEKLKRAKEDVVIMHPGPINRGIELASDVADGEHSVILNQVTNGVAVRMAILYLLSGGTAETSGA